MDACYEEIAGHHNDNRRPDDITKPFGEVENHQKGADAKFRNEHSVDRNRLRVKEETHGLYSPFWSNERIGILSPIALVYIYYYHDVACGVHKLTSC
jgi:hypothetical protein